MSLVFKEDVEGYSHDICILNGREPVSYGDRRTTFRSLIKSRLHNLLRVGVQRRSCLVQEKNLGVTNQSSCDRDSLCRTISNVGLLIMPEYIRFCPPESCEPFPPTSVSNPLQADRSVPKIRVRSTTKTHLGSDLMKSKIFAFLQASSSSS